MIKVSTAKGKALYERTKRDCGRELNQIYSRYSEAKMHAMEECKSRYCDDPHSRDFRIISYNTYGFSVAWSTIYELDTVFVPGVHIETPHHSYDVVLI